MLSSKKPLFSARSRKELNVWVSSRRRENALRAALVGRSQSTGARWELCESTYSEVRMRATHPFGFRSMGKIFGAPWRTTIAIEASGGGVLSPNRPVSAVVSKMAPMVRRCERMSVHEPPKRETQGRSRKTQSENGAIDKEVLPREIKNVGEDVRYLGRLLLPSLRNLGPWEQRQR